MVDFLLRSVRFQQLALLFLWLQKEWVGAWASEKVYFDKYGHCSSSTPFSLKDETYQVFAKGGGFSHETLDCSLTFKAAPGYGVCLSFEDFVIDECSVQLLIYESKSNGGEVWKTVSCLTDRPSQMCTSERYITLRVLKQRLIRNKGYDFEIEIEQSSSVTDEGVVFASIGFVVSIICGVVLLLIFIALIIYCCCRNKGETTKTSVPLDPVQPSAPPLLGEDQATSTIHQDPSHLYPHLQQNKPMLDSPPPYELPPSYSPKHH